MKPTGLLAVTPMKVGVNEDISIKVKVLGEVRKIPSMNYRGSSAIIKPGLTGPFNLNVERGSNYLDNVLPEWKGRLTVEGGHALDGPGEIEFDGENQGVFPGDSRPIKHCTGWRWTQPGIYWITLTEPETGIEVLTNPVIVEEKPEKRVYWGDIHWQTFFTDGLRIPEELYAFARDEAFLDFGALTDHANRITDFHWRYFQDVTNAYNQPDVFATLVGYEWTSMKWGHRNIYFPGETGPILRSDLDAKTLPELWEKLDTLDALAIPHHSSNTVMGVDWENGWNPVYEKAVEIHSVWGNSERHADEGNPMPNRTNKGEKKGQHVVDALNRDYRFGFVGGGDIHDGRPGDELDVYQENPPQYRLHAPQGFTAVIAGSLNRKNVYNSIKTRSTYATTKSRIYLNVRFDNTEMGGILSIGNSASRKVDLNITCAAPEKIKKAVLVHNGKDKFDIKPGDNSMLIQQKLKIETPAPGDYCYVRITTEKGNLAWSSPVWVEK